MQSTEPEIWAPIVGHEGSYEVSNQGRVRSLPRIVDYGPGQGRGIKHRRGRVLRPGGLPQNYLSVVIDGKTRSVHTLVLEAFVGPRPAGYYGCHNDGDSRNNTLGNLRWDTPAANTRDLIEHGRHHLASREVCKRGHLLSEPNLRVGALAKGRRDCLSCARTRSICSQANKPFDPEMADRKYAEIMRRQS